MMTTETDVVDQGNVREWLAAAIGGLRAASACGMSSAAATGIEVDVYSGLHFGDLPFILKWSNRQLSMPPDSGIRLSCALGV